MYTWYVKILLDCGEYVYITIGLNNTNSWYVNWEYKAFSIEKAEYDYQLTP